MVYTEDKEEVTLPYITEVMNLALKAKTISLEFLQACTDWLAMKAYKILSAYDIELHDRKIKFMGFDNRLRCAGHCNISKLKYSANIFLSKWLLVPNNAHGILNVLAHEVLHAILPFKERHGHTFKMAVDILNRSMNLQIQVVGIVGEIKYPPVKYELYCPHCHKVLACYYRKSKRIKHPEKCFHISCGSTLQVITL